MMRKILIFTKNLYSTFFDFAGNRTQGNAKKMKDMEPKIAKKGPYAVDLEVDKSYYWCACGQSKNQPYCDGSHKGTEFKPVLFKPNNTGKAYLCGCKNTKNPPYCDGTHNSL
jgi:CDGSH-type Zn-finger protein